MQIFKKTVKRSLPVSLSKLIEFAFKTHGLNNYLDIFNNHIRPIPLFTVLTINICTNYTYHELTNQLS